MSIRKEEHIRKTINSDRTNKLFSFAHSYSPTSPNPQLVMAVAKCAMKSISSLSSTLLPFFSIIKPRIEMQDRKYCGGLRRSDWGAENIEVLLVCCCFRWPSACPVHQMKTTVAHKFIFLDCLLHRQHRRYARRQSLQRGWANLLTDRF